MANALQERSLSFEILAESIPQIVWSTDAAGRHDYFNGRWSEFTGILPSEITPTTWERLVHRDDWARVSETWTHCLATGEVYDIDYRFRFRDGGFRWLKVMAKPLRNSAGEICRWYGTATDIEDSKKLETQKELVANELDHRIKNIFALVNGLLRLSIREEPELDRLADNLRSRLQTLHQAHGLVRGSGQSNASTIRELLVQLLGPYRSDDEAKISIVGDAAVGSGAISSVALIFHELITNAAKYGALAHEDGRLRVILKAEEDTQRIFWHERFQGAASLEATDGFGTRLLKTMIEQQFRGSLVRYFSVQGLMIQIGIPQAALGAMK